MSLSLLYLIGKKIKIKKEIKKKKKNKRKEKSENTFKHNVRNNLSSNKMCIKINTSKNIQSFPIGDS
jgi:hypothetical protein